MAKKQKVNKSQAVRDYAKAHPEATSGEIAVALNKKGIKITANYVANIKTKLNKLAKTKKAPKQPKVVEVTEPVVEKPIKNGGLTVEQVKKVSLLMKTLGGLKGVNEVLDAVKEIGGVKKFKELAAAIAGTESDVVPF
jgi:predicted flavoprotein YhiN